MVTQTRVDSRAALEVLSALDAAAIGAMSWTPVLGCPGVEQKLLWQLGGFTVALLRYGPGASTPGKPHFAAHHHIWVVSGAITIVGRRLTAGSYVHVPSGVAHSGVDSATRAASCCRCTGRTPLPRQPRWPASADHRRSAPAQGLTTAEARDRLARDGPTASRRSSRRRHGASSPARWCTSSPCCCVPLPGWPPSAGPPDWRIDIAGGTPAALAHLWLVQQALVPA